MHLIASSPLNPAKKESSMNFADLRMMIVALVLFSNSVISADPGFPPDERDEIALQVAKAWFTSLMKGETAVTTALSDVPFSFDGKRNVESHGELKQIFDQVVARKGKRDLKPESAKIKSSSPDKIEVALKIESDDEGIVITIKPEPAYRVVGFRD
jgi:hypothetical protein